MNDAITARAILARAGLTPSPAEIYAYERMLPRLREVIETLYAVDGVQDATPALHFEPRARQPQET